MRLDEKHKTMYYILDEDEGEEGFPCRYEVCPRCEGEGKHVNPSIDGNGLTQSDFDEDPQFREDYFSGMYDVTCYECHGNRVVPELDWSNISAVDADRLHSYLQEQADYEAMVASERRMGA